MKNEENIILKLQLDDIKIIMNALAKLPFENVYEIIGKINNQTNAQISVKS
jgi:hypothetical protein